MSSRLPTWMPVLPSDWQAATIDQLAIRVGSGVTPTGGSEVYTESGVTFIRSQNVTNNGLSLDDVAFISQRTHEQMSASEVYPFDVLLNITGASIGRCCFLPEGIGPTNVNQHVCAIRFPKPDTHDAKFLASVLASPIGQSQIFRLNAGGNREGLNYQQLRSFRVPWPPKKVRRAVSEILTTVDEAMEQTEALVGKLEQMKAGLMHDLFTRGVTPDGHLRPTRQEAPQLYHETPLGWIPKEWEVKPFRSVLSANLQNGYFKKPELVGRGFKLVNVSELYQPLGIDTEQADVERVEASPADYQRYGVAEGDLFFTRSSLVLTGIAHCNVMLKLHEPTLFECHVIRAKPDLREADPAYLGLYFQTASARRELMARAKHTTMTTISQPDILAVPILKPPLDEQKRISKSIATNMAAIHAEELLLAKLRQQKQGLMQDLLTGRVPVRTAS